jgi:hypothetical protein
VGPGPDGDLGERFQEVDELLDAKLDFGQALAFKVQLLLILEDVAKASGGRFGFGSKISEAEKETLLWFFNKLAIEPWDNFSDRLG